jgi:hypothetical protein
VIFAVAGKFIPTNMDNQVKWSVACSSGTDLAGNPRPLPIVSVADSVQADTSRCRLDGEPEETSSVEDMDRRPVLLAFANVSGEPLVARYPDEIRDELIVPVAMDGSR